MKKILITMAAVLMLAATLLVGCGETETAATNEPVNAPETLEGTTWTVTNYVLGDNDILLLAKENNETDSLIVSFEKDGELKMEGMGQSIEGTYTYEDGYLTTEGITAPVQDGTIILESDSVAMTLVENATDIAE